MKINKRTEIVKTTKRQKLEYFDHICDIQKNTKFYILLCKEKSRTNEAPGE